MKATLTAFPSVSSFVAAATDSQRSTHPHARTRKIKTTAAVANAGSTPRNRYRVILTSPREAL